MRYIPLPAPKAISAAPSAWVSSVSTAGLRVDLNRQLARNDLPPAERERLEAAERDLQDTYLAINDGYEFYVDGDELSEALDDYPD